MEDHCYTGDSYMNVSNCSYDEDYLEHIMNQDLNRIYAVNLMRNICIPLITVVGLLGNTLSLLVFSASSMKMSSCSVFLAALALADNFFLMCLLITWIDGEWYALLRHDVTCQLLVFTTYVASFLSVWFIVGFSLERFIAICFPLKNRNLCSVFREKVVVIGITAVGCLLYSFSFWTTGMQFWGTRERCSHRIEFFQFLEIATWVDTVLTMVIPFVIIVTVNTKILHSVLNFNKKLYVQRKVVNKKRRRHSNMAVPDSNPKVTSSTRSRSSPKIRVTRTLLLVSTIFLLLNLPSHIIRLYNLIRSITHQNDQTVTVKIFFLQELTLMLYYFTFSCNFIVYTVFGKNFQSSLRAIWRCQSTNNHQRKNMLRRVSSTQGGLSTSL